MSYKWRVDIIEFERGWGQRLDDVRWFDTEQEAKDFANQYNSRNPPGPVPDWYMAAMAPVKQVVP